MYCKPFRDVITVFFLLPANINRNVFYSQLTKNLGPLKIRVKGLEYMNDDPTEVDVLYGKVEIEGDKNQLLQQISDELVEYFVEEGKAS